MPAKPHVCAKRTDRESTPPAPTHIPDPVAELLAGVEKPRLREWLRKFFTDEAGRTRADQQPKQLDEVMDELTEELASDPEAEGRRELARKMIARRDDQAAADPPPHPDTSEDRDWGRPRKPR